jgi:hypothetical protein
MYRMYGTRATQDQLPRSYCREAITAERSTNFAWSKIERVLYGPKGKLQGSNLLSPVDDSVV